MGWNRFAGHAEVPRGRSSCVTGSGIASCRWGSPKTGRHRRSSPATSNLPAGSTGRFAGLHRGGFTGQFALKTAVKLDSPTVPVTSTQRHRHRPVALINYPTLIDVTAAGSQTGGDSAYTATNAAPTPRAAQCYCG